MKKSNKKQEAEFHEIKNQRKIIQTIIKSHLKKSILE